MSSIILEGPIADVREREVRLLFDTAELVGQFGDDGQHDRARIQRNANDLRDMFFMVVVIGEFNAGKSSFVNAILGDEVLAMGITPTTEAIELVRYGKQKSSTPTVREDGIIREWTHPNTGAPGVVIVDTPGTGSVFAKHERIAKDFLSRSDLVIFLLSAKRAFAQTEKIYLELARDYGKKILLVINQVDLLEKKELKEVENFVKQQVSDLLNLDPPIFLVSAKQALKGSKGLGLFGTSTADTSGMDIVKSYLLEAFKKTPPAKQKLIAQLDFADSMHKKYMVEIQKRLDLVVDDERQAKQLREELEKQAETLSGQLSTSMRELDRVFEQLRERGRKFISDNLSVNGLGQLFRTQDKDKIRAKFETDVVGSTLQQINSISEDYVNAVVDSSRRYWRGIIDRLNKMDEILKEQVVSPDAGSYSEQRLALQEAIAIADSELKTYTNNNLSEKLNDIFSANLTGFNLSILGFVGGLLTLIGIPALPGAVAGVGLVFMAAAVPAAAIGGILAVGYWQKLRHDAYQELDNRLDALRKSYQQALQELTDRERSRLLQYGQQILSPVFSRLEVVADNYRKQQQSIETLKKASADLRADLDRIQIITE